MNLLSRFSGAARLRWQRGLTIAIVLLCLECIGCSKGTAMALTLSSPVFQHQGTIPVEYTCDGQDLSPPLQWSEIPETAKSLVLIVDDPDAPDPKAPKMTWVHWVLYNIPPTTRELPKGVSGKDLPFGTLEGLNDWKRTGYGGPCPPIGQHRYFHKLYALDRILSNLNTPTKQQVEAAMKGHILGTVELVGTYQRSSNR
jgi:Raf kinase inhibitor-like YbhB/YbcL family protein